VRIYYEDEISGEPVFWDGAPYGQENGQTTREEGLFCWDVPDGNWQLRCYLEGYETYIGQWLTVPPQHFDIGIPMVSLQPPVVECSGINDSCLELTFSKYMQPNSVRNITVTDIDGNQIPYTLEYVQAKKALTGWSMLRHTYCAYQKTQVHLTLFILMSRYVAMQMSE
jgi:hypothetical protein